MRLALVIAAGLAVALVARRWNTTGLEAAALGSAHERRMERRRERERKHRRESP